MPSRPPRWANDEPNAEPIPGPRIGPGHANKPRVPKKAMSSDRAMTLRDEPYGHFTGERIEEQTGIFVSSS